MALGRALRASDPAGAIAAFERATKLVADDHRRRKARICKLSRSRMAAADKAARPQALEAMTVDEHTAVDAARQLVTLIDPEKDKPAACGRACSASSPSIRSIRRRTRRWVAWLLHQAKRRRRCATSASRWPPARSIAPRHTQTLPRVAPRSGNRAEAKREALAALEIAPTYERAQELLLKLVDGPIVSGWRSDACAWTHWRVAASCSRPGR